MSGPRTEVFRRRWLQRRGAGYRPGALVRQPRWTGPATWVLLVAVLAGALLLVGVTVSVSDRPGAQRLITLLVPEGF